MKEQWKPLGFGKEVSNLGRVKRVGRRVQNVSVSWGKKKTISTRRIKEQISYGSPNHHGYMKVSVGNTHVLIHRAVAKAFIPNPENKPLVNHKDFNRKNNKVTNLEWATALENNMHAIKNGHGRWSSPYSTTN